MNDLMIAEIKKLQADVQEIKELLSGPVPPWAKDAIDKAVELRIVTEPGGGSRDFYRFVTIMNRLGLLTREEDKQQMKKIGDGYLASID